MNKWLEQVADVCMVIFGLGMTIAVIPINIFRRMLDDKDGEDE